MKFIDFFAGVGGFRRGMELAGHECVGFCEWDKFATASYTSMHLITEDQRKSLAELTMKQRQKEILKEEYRNGEWYAGDIRSVSATDLPKADCWCFGAPCQSFSLAGKRAGLEGESGLVREIFRLLNELQEEDRPEWLIYENVKGMLSSNHGWDYAAILSEMDECGYDIEWQNINSKWFVPQNRERIYTIGHLIRFGSRKIFSFTGANGENSILQITSDGREPNIAVKIGNTNPCGYGMNGNVYDSQAVGPTLTTNKGQGNKIAIKIIGSVNSSQDGKIHEVSGISKCHSDGHNNSPKVAIPVLTPDRVNKRQNGRRFKEDGEPMFTITAQDRHGVAVAIDDAYGCEGIRIYENYVPALRSETHGDVPELCVDMSGKIPKQKGGVYVEMPEGFWVYAIWYEKYQCYIAIRKLTPKECFRLQGWTDDYFEKAAFVSSDSQLYKQAGNGVTVSVVQSIAEKLN